MGSTVYVGVLPAMFDPRTFKHPDKFDADRPADAYLHFGGGLHECFGRYANVVQIPELVAALVRLDGLRFAGSRRSGILYDGPFPDRFVVEFDRVA
jgi:cytochrome P450